MKFTIFPRAFVVLCLVASCSNKNNVNKTPPEEEPPANDTTVSKIVYWQTSANESMLLQRMPAIAYTTTTNAHPTIDIDTASGFQTMDGFGYTLTGGSAMLINKMTADAKSNLLNELFGEGDNSIHVSYLRISIGASDLSANVFTYDDVPKGQTDPSLDQFSLNPDKTDLIPLLKEIIAISPSIKILATPWTPPLWMKTNENSVGGSLKPEFYGAYANYFVKYIQAMKAEGITITAITTQNEPLNPENNPSLLMEATQQRDFIKNHLGPAFQNASISTKIILFDHNCDRPDYPLTILSDPAAKAFVDGSAFHLYAGSITALTEVHEAHPDKNVYFTEQYTASTGQFGGDLQWHLKNLVIGAPRNWSKMVLEWNLANDANFGPHTPGGCTTCKGALTIDGSTVNRNVAYYIIAHISKFVPPGSIRVESNVLSGFQTVAFKTPSGDKILVVLNENTTTVALNVRFNRKFATASLPAGSAATFVVK